LQRQPVASAAALGQIAALAPATVNTALARLQGLGIVDELTARRRGRVFAYSRYVSLLNAELDGVTP
jgi:DNA-binding transcriptional ArsR family regulator